MLHARLAPTESRPRTVRMRTSQAILAAALLLGGARSQAPEPVHLHDVDGRGPRALCVVAHPDDEIAFSGTVYKLATHLGAAVDVVVITNGEAGYKYSLLAERIYGLKLTDPEVGRRELPGIRKREMTEACRLLGVRDVYFLGQTDHRYNQDANEVLGPDADVWDLGLVRSTLDARLGTGGYGFVFVHLPTPTTHGHHQAASILALEAVARLAPHARPVVLGSYPTRIADDAEPPPTMLEGRPVTRHIVGNGPYVFDLMQKFGFREKLDYRVVTNLAATQHRSQGTYLLSVGRREAEGFVRFALETPDADAKARELFARLAEPQFEPMDYDEDGNLIERR